MQLNIPLNLFQHPLAKSKKVRLPNGTEETVMNCWMVGVVITEIIAAQPNDMKVQKRVIESSVNAGADERLVKELIVKTIALDPAAIRQLQALIAEGFTKGFLEKQAK